MLRYRSRGLLTSGGRLPYSSSTQMRRVTRNALPDRSGKEWHVIVCALVE